MQLNNTITTILSTTTKNSEGFALLKAQGLKPWQGTGMHPHTWMKKALDQLHGQEPTVHTGFDGDSPCVVDTMTPEDIVAQAQTNKEAIENIFVETGKDLTDLFTQAKAVYNPHIIEVVMKEDKGAAQAVEIFQLIQQARKNLNWVAKLQLTEADVILRSDDGMEEIYDAQMETKLQFEQAHDEQMIQVCTVIVEAFSTMGKEYTRAQKKAKQKAHQEKLAAEKKEREEAKAAAQERARKTNTPQGKMELEFSKAKQALLAKMHRALNYRQDHVKKAALAEYKRLTEVCQLTIAQAVQQIMIRFN